MQMLMVRPSGTLSCGSKKRVPIVRERGRKYGPITAERVLSVKKDILITGANSSGKTRWLAKLDDKAHEVWVGREKIYFRGMEPLQRWYEDPRVAQSVAGTGRDWSRLKAYERADALIAWVKETKAVVIMDDAHKLAGRKLDIAIQLGRESGRFVVGAFAENSIPMSLRMLIERRDPQRISLTSEAAYDVTNLAMWLAILAAMSAGAWPLAAVMGGMKVLAGGRRAARQA